MIKRFLACCKEGEGGITTEGPASFVVSLSRDSSLVGGGEGQKRSSLPSPSKANGRADNKKPQ